MREPHEVARVGVLIAMIGGRGALEEAWQLYSRARIEQGSEYAAHIFWSKIERRVLVAVLDELVVQCKDSRFPGAKTLRVKVGNTRDLLAHQPVATALGLFDASYDALRRELYGLSYGVPADYHVHIVNTARAALCLPRDPLALWDYMLEQLWLSAHDKTGGEAGMAQRLHDALVTIFEEEPCATTTTSTKHFSPVSGRESTRARDPARAGFGPPAPATTATG